MEKAELKASLLVDSHIINHRIDNSLLTEGRTLMIEGPRETSYQRSLLDPMYHCQFRHYPGQGSITLHVLKRSAEVVAICAISRGRR